MPNHKVRISTKALVPISSASSSNLVRYARITLLETVPADKDNDGTISTDGIQVLNFVVLPSDQTTLPVLGIDLVSLPGGRHLLLLDAQPMTADNSNDFESHWKEWYERHVTPNTESIFPWGGDFPEPVQKYVSQYSLWTRLQEVEEPTDAIQNQVWEAFCEHLDLYVDLLGKYHEGDDDTTTSSKIMGENWQPAYLDYRRGNDPAKPMLNSLFGVEWTDQLLEEVLFPKK
ncbi:MAG: hypothetical protein SGARI_004124 [Bacillariaceae sp.]